MLALGIEGSIETSSGVIMNGGIFSLGSACGSCTSPDGLWRWGGAVNIKSLSGDSGTVNMYSKDLNITSPGNNDKLGADITGNGGTITVFAGQDAQYAKEGFGGNVSGQLNLVTYAGATDVYNEMDYSGATTVKYGGRLHIYGSVPNTSNVTIEDGGLLNGAGTIGSRNSTTYIQTGGTIESGYAANPRDDLKIGGNLTVDGTSDFTRTTSQHGGLIKVGGDLTLNGEVLAHSSFDYVGSGVRTLYLYEGTVQTGDKLSLNVYGTPQGGTDSFQIGHHQVNLVEANSTDNLSLWNGTHMTPTNQVEGGSGVWKQDDTAQTNWTNAAGTESAPWAAGSYAIFQHSTASSPENGAITVAGTVDVGGMQFTPAHNGNDTQSYYLIP